MTVSETSHARIESATRDGKSACLWDFYPDHATLTLLRIDLPTFWFLYEGTPGGKLDAQKDFVIRPDGQKTTLDQPWSQVVPWVCFGSAETPVGLVLVNHQSSEPAEVDSYVSWPFRKEPDGSFQDMTVFGFGRKGYKELVQHVPDLKRLPARFSIAFVDRADAAVAKALSERMLTASADARTVDEACLRAALKRTFRTSTARGSLDFDAAVAARPSDLPRPLALIRLPDRCDAVPAIKRT